MPPAQRPALGAPVRAETEVPWRVLLGQSTVVTAGEPKMSGVDLTRYEASFAELDTTTLYALLKLRTDVFVVEQACPYPELDGRDIEPGTRHLWLDSPGHPYRSCSCMWSL